MFLCKMAKLFQSGFAAGCFFIAAEGIIGTIERVRIVKSSKIMLTEQRRKGV